MAKDPKSIFVVLVTEEVSRKKATYLVGCSSSKDAKKLVQDHFQGDRVEMVVGELDENGRGVVAVPDGEVVLWD